MMDAKQSSSMSTKAHARLSALTALACFVWLAQAVYTAMRKNQLWYWPNVVFYLSMALIVGYTGYVAVHDWSSNGPGDGGSEDQAGGDGAPDGGNVKSR